MSKIIAIGSDHAGYELKEKIKTWLAAEGYTPQDEGCFDTNSVNYPDIGKSVSLAVQKGEAERGILICGTGIGMSIAANKFKGIRATLCHNEDTASMSRQHNNSNMLVLGARVLTEDLAKKIFELWLNTPFEGGRHQDRLDLIEQQ